jgi:hypothetical protein
MLPDDQGMSLSKEEHNLFVEEFPQAIEQGIAHGPVAAANLGVEFCTGEVQVVRNASASYSRRLEGLPDIYCRLSILSIACSSSTLSKRGNWQPAVDLPSS